nr:tryptophan-rich sensory protein [Streptomyces cyanogenus]
MWQPPPWAFGVVWTPLYATIAYAGGPIGGHGSRNGDTGPSRRHG